MENTVLMSDVVGCSGQDKGRNVQLARYSSTLAVWQS